MRQIGHTAQQGDVRRLLQGGGIVRTGVDCYRIGTGIGRQH